MSSHRETLGWLVAVAVVFAAGCGRTPKPLTPEAASAKGEALLREMSKNLGGLQTFAFTATERREKVKGGSKSEIQTSRRVTIRRPNRFMLTTSGDREGAAWYDGKSLTLVANKAKVWARGPMPPTLDAAIDFLSDEYAIPLPSADLLYSNPYDAFIARDTKGGWVDTQKIGDRTCDHLAYTQEAVDWELWLGEGKRLPCQIRIVYKNEPGKPSTTVTYSEMDEAPTVTDDTFVAKVPDGYQRIKIIRHATVDDPTVRQTSGEAPPKK